MGLQTSYSVRKGPAAAVRKHLSGSRCALIFHKHGDRRVSEPVPSLHSTCIYGLSPRFRPPGRRARGLPLILSSTLRHVGNHSLAYRITFCIGRPSRQGHQVGRRHHQTVGTIVTTVLRRMGVVSGQILTDTRTLTSFYNLSAMSRTKGGSVAHYAETLSRLGRLNFVSCRHH